MAWRALAPRGLAAGLARCGAAWRGLATRSGSVPKLNELSSVAALVAAHREHRRAFRPADVGAWWNSLGRVVSTQPAERQLLRSEPAQRWHGGR